MKKIAQGIVRLRKLILTVAILLLIPSAIGAIATRINYDILTYLPQDLDSMIGEVALEDDFHLASTGMITVEGLPTNELIAMKKEIEAVPGVTQTFWLSDVIDPSIPTEMLPADVQQFMFGRNDSTMLIVRFDAPSASDETMNAVSQIETLLRKDCFFGGMSVILQDTKALVNQEMPLYILIAVGASLLVLFLSLESTITPLLFMLGLLFPIAYNFGTNIFLGQISYITEALATVLQLGVTMDFSIFLLHRYQEEKELRSNNEEAMVSAICKTMTSISASSLTTIAGFLALCAMRLTLGRDIGTVVFPNAQVKVFLTADPRERARRRVLQRHQNDAQPLTAEQLEAEVDETLDALKQRDKLDSSREVAPLVSAEDAVHVDSTAHTIDEVVRIIEDLINQRRKPMSERIMKMDRNDKSILIRALHARYRTLKASGQPCEEVGRLILRIDATDPGCLRLEEAEYLLARNALNDLRNQRIASGGYTDAADAALANLLRAKVPFHLFGHTR